MLELTERSETAGPGHGIGKEGALHQHGTNACPKIVPPLPRGVKGIVLAAKNTNKTVFATMSPKT